MLLGGCDNNWEEKVFCPPYSSTAINIGTAPDLSAKATLARCVGSCKGAGINLCVFNVVLRFRVARTYGMRQVRETSPRKSILRFKSAFAKLSLIGMQKGSWKSASVILLPRAFFTDQKPFLNIFRPIGPADAISRPILLQADYMRDKLSPRFLHALLQLFQLCREFNARRAGVFCRIVLRKFGRPKISLIQRASRSCRMGASIVVANGPSTLGSQLACCRPPPVFAWNQAFFPDFTLQFKPRVDSSALPKASQDGALAGGVPF